MLGWGVCSSPTWAQDRRLLDSLETALQKNTVDSLEVDILNQIGEHLIKQRSSKALYYLETAEDLARAANYQKGRLSTLFLMGLYYEQGEDFDDAIIKYDVARTLAEQAKDESKVATLLMRIAKNYNALNQKDRSVFFYFKAAQLYRQLEDFQRQAQAIRPIAEIFYNLEKYDRALKYFLETLSLVRNTRDTLALVEAIKNVGNAYNQTTAYEEALQTLEEGLDLAQALGDRVIVAEVYITLGAVYNNLDKDQEAEFYVLKALDMAQKMEAPGLISDAYNTLSDIFSRKKRYYDALRYQTQALRSLKGDSYFNRKIRYYLKISDIYANINDFNNALRYHRAYTNLRDSLDNQRTLEAIAKSDLQYESNRRINRLESEKKLGEEKLRQRRIINYSLGIGLMIILTFTFFLYRSNQKYVRANDLLIEQNHQIQRQKDEISSQKTSLESINKELAKKNQQLIELDNEKNDLIGVVAHDLRSPINQVKGFIEIIKLSANNLSKDQTLYIDLAAGALERLDRMINRILDVNALEKQEINLQLQRVDIADLLHTLVDTFSEVAHKKHIEIIRELARNRHYSQLDENYAMQIFENLLSNAFKFSPPGRKVYIITTLIQDKIRVLIKDEGPGISNEDKKKIFRKFQKLSAKPTGGEPSTGLGLSIVKKYVELMDGRVWVESVLGRGATFIVEFQKDYSEE